MGMTGDGTTRREARLSGEDLTFWWADSPMQPTRGRGSAAACTGEVGGTAEP
jgi:hypothetical protein